MLTMPGVFIPVKSSVQSVVPERMSTSQYRAMLATGQIPKVKIKRATPEEDLHRDCMEFVLRTTARNPILRWMVHVPNGGKRPKGEAGKLKAMGTKPGYPDLTLPRRHTRWMGLAIELKSPIGTVSPDQKEWLGAFVADGWLVAVCRSLDEFIAVLHVFLEGGDESSLPTLWRPARP